MKIEIRMSGFGTGVWFGNKVVEIEGSAMEPIRQAVLDTVVELNGTAIDPKFTAHKIEVSLCPFDLFPEGSGQSFREYTSGGAIESLQKQARERS